MSKELSPLEIKMPNKRSLAVLSMVLEDATGAALHRNFTTFNVSAGPSPRTETLNSPDGGGKLHLVRFAPQTFASSHWTLKEWSVLNGLKVDGAGSGYFEYRIPWPQGVDAKAVRSASLRFEASAKQLFGKDRKGAARQDGDFMLGKGTHDPSLNPNSYPMTDTKTFPSAVRVRIAGESAGTFELPNDPADHRGILSWHAQIRDKKLREAGSYGYLLNASIPQTALQAAAAAGEIVVRFEVDPALPGGLALYGENFGRFPLDPTLILVTK
jgi:hypothetical protein